MFCGISNVIGLFLKYRITILHSFFTFIKVEDFKTKISIVIRINFGNFKTKISIVKFYYHA